MSKYDKKGWQKRIVELYDKELISQSQKESLSSMLSSKDNENTELVIAVSKTFVKETLASVLNPEQAIAFDEIIEHFENPQHSAVVLKGYAGTGKTFLVKKLIEYIMQTEPDSRMAITAPTNKAVKVLYANSSAAFNEEAYVFEDIFDSDSRLIYSTTHKVLGMKEIITEDGKQLFEIDSFSGAGLDKFEYVLVDEVSMLDDRLTHALLSNKKIRVLFIGDPAQVPPVNKTDSIPLLGSNQQYTFKEVVLSQIMRQKGENPIIAHSFTIRENLSLDKPIPNIKTETNGKEGIEVLNPEKDKTLIREILKSHIGSAAFQKDPDYFKVLAWRKNTVNYMNNLIREQLYGEQCPRFVIGEKLVAQKPVFKKAMFKSRKGASKEYWKVVINNSEEMVVEDIKKGAITVKVMNKTRVFDADELVVSFDNIMNNKTSQETIKIIVESQQAEFLEMLEDLKRNAKNTGNKVFWVMYFDALKYSADVGYNYALTVHKSQGSTYENVLVLENDIDANRKVIERNRIKYTAYTRASKKLYVWRVQDLVESRYRDYRTEDYTSCGPT